MRDEPESDARVWAALVLTTLIAVWAAGVLLQVVGVELPIEGIP